jgi:hypothetical protein
MTLGVDLRVSPGYVAHVIIDDPSLFRQGVGGVILRRA